MIFESNFHVSQTEVPIDTPSTDDQKSDEQKPIYHSDLLVVIGDPKAPYGLDYKRLITNSFTTIVVVAADANVNDGMKFKSAMVKGPVTLAEAAIAGAAPD